MALTDKLTAIGDAVRSQTGITEPMTLDEMAVAITNFEGGKEYNWGRGLQYDETNNVVRVNAGSTIGFNQSGRMDVYQGNLFITGSTHRVVNADVGPVAMNIEVVGINVPFDDTNWFANLTTNDVIDIKFSTADMGMGGAKTPNSIVQSAVGMDGITYAYLLDLSGVIGPNMAAGTGFNKIEVGYNEGSITFLIRRDISIALGDIIHIDFGKQETEKSFAHYYIRRPRQFVIEGQRIMINEDYINELIDNKIDAIPVAEEVSV